MFAAPRVPTVESINISMGGIPMRPHATHRRGWRGLAGLLLLATALTACSDGINFDGPDGGGAAVERSGGGRGPAIPGVLPTEVTTSPHGPQPTEESTDEPTGESGDERGDDPTGAPGGSSGDNLISGHAYTRDGSPVAGAMIYIYILPRTLGSLYRTQTGADGSYSYSVPGGVYLIQAAVDNDNPNLIVDLVPRQTTSDGVASVSVPPSQVVDFDAP
jgi:hypothetical protein